MDIITRSDIRKWLNEGRRKGDTHIVVVQDTFDNSYFPISVNDRDSSARAHSVEEALRRFDGTNMTRVIEIYNMSMDIDKQLAQNRAWNV